MNAPALLHLILKILYFIVPFAVTWFSLSLTSMYMSYYDIGVNSGANNGFLLFFLGPVLLIVLFITAVTSTYFANRFFTSRWPGILLGSFLMLLIGGGSFFLQVRYTADYPTETEQDMTLFFGFLAREMCGKLSEDNL
jgi:DMSO/TMAO reductase YedYZ heme-binding membrane subunit